MPRAMAKRSAAQLSTRATYTKSANKTIGFHAARITVKPTSATYKSHVSGVGAGLRVYFLNTAVRSAFIFAAFLARSRPTSRRLSSRRALRAAKQVLEFLSASFSRLGFVLSLEFKFGYVLPQVRHRRQRHIGAGACTALCLWGSARICRAHRQADRRIRQLSGPALAV